MSVKCDSTSGTCEVQTQGASAPSTGSCKVCGSCCGGDPIACSMAMWACSFFQAMKAAQVDTLKAKIQKAWGPKMEKAADAVLEAMGVKWQSMLAEAKAKEDLRTKLQGLWQ